MEPHFMMMRLEVAAGQGKKPMSYFRSLVIDRRWTSRGGIQVPHDVLKASQLEMLTLFGL